MCFKKHAIKKVEKDYNTWKQVALDFLDQTNPTEFDGIVKSVPIRKKANEDYKTALQVATAQKEASYKVALQVMSGKQSLDGVKVSNSKSDMHPIHVDSDDDLDDIISDLGSES